MNVSTTAAAAAPAANRVTFDAHDREFVFAVALRIVRSTDDADDVAQEALLLALRNRDSFRGESRYRTWLYRIAVTTSLSFLRRRRRRHTEALTARCEVFADPSEPSDEQLARREQHALAARALEELSPSYREILLARLDGSELEVASQMGISVSNVKVRAHRARRRLKETLDLFTLAAA